jgi:hypothetical protein
MLHVITDQAPWYIAGPAMGLIVVGMYAVANKHLGVTGSFVQFVDAARQRPVQIWRFWFLAGLLLGSASSGSLEAPLSLHSAMAHWRACCLSASWCRFFLSVASWSASVRGGLEPAPPAMA